MLGAPLKCNPIQQLSHEFLYKDDVQFGLTISSGDDELDYITIYYEVFLIFCPFTNMRDISIYSCQNNAAIFVYCKSDLTMGTTNGT